jgi:hypothetical protein
VASGIHFDDQYHQVSNARFDSLIAFGLQVATETGRSDEERRWIERLRAFQERVFAGIGLNLKEQFPEVNEKKFWARVYFDVSRRIFLRQLGNQDTTCWQSSAIGDSFVIAQMLCRLLRESGERIWPLDTEDGREEDAYRQSKPWKDLPDSVKEEAATHFRTRRQRRARRPDPGNSEDAPPSQPSS